MQIEGLSWFPGHMTKTKRMIVAEIKNMDAVCEILDARIPLSSRNPDVDEMTAGKIGHGKFLLKLTPDEPTSPEAASGDSALRPDGTRASTGRTLSPFVIILLSTGAMRERTNPHPNHLPLNSRSGPYVTTTVLDRTWKDDAAGVLAPQRPFPHSNRRYTLK